MLSVFSVFPVQSLVVVVNLENLWKHVEFTDKFHYVAILGKKKKKKNPKKPSRPYCLKLTKGCL